MILGTGSLFLLPTVFENIYAVLTGSRVNGVRDGVNVYVSLAEESSRCLEADQEYQSYCTYID